MRDLLVSVNPTLWNEISGIFFGACFVALVLWVYRPGGKRRYSQHEKLPLDSE